MVLSMPLCEDDVKLLWFFLGECRPCDSYRKLTCKATDSPPFVRSMTSLEKAATTVTVRRRSQKTQTRNRSELRSPGSPGPQGSAESSLQGCPRLERGAPPACGGPGDGGQGPREGPHEWESPARTLPSFSQQWEGSREPYLACFSVYDSSDHSWELVLVTCGSALY